MSYTFFPGCSLSATALPYAMSSREVARVLGLDMPDLEDWNCCGSTAFQTLDETSFLTLSARNLALAEKVGGDGLVTSCTGCFAALRKARDHLSHDPQLRREVEAALGEAGVSYGGGVEVRHLLDVLVADVGLDAIRAKVTDPLTGLRVVCYYGCLLSRPPATTGASHPENPLEMDRLVSALGAEPLDWSYKTECCGASLSIPRPELVTRLATRILDNARDVGAQALVVACPLCQVNLDAYQDRVGKPPVPIVYFTELMGLAFGLPPKRLGLDKHFRDPVPVVCRRIAQR